jgi:hypothetical protein
MEAVIPELPKQPSMLEQIRNMWEFANLTQWIFTFGKAVKLDENMDSEVCKPSDILSTCRIIEF